MKQEDKQIADADGKIYNWKCGKMMGIKNLECGKCGMSLECGKWEVKMWVISIVSLMSVSLRLR
jgi:hypothetical protein